MACGDGAGGGNEAGGEDDIYYYSVVLPTNGSLTITGLGAYNSYYVVGGSGIGWVNFESLESAANISNNGTYTGSQISGGQVTIKVWKVINETTIGNYNGNHNASFDVIISNKPDMTYTDQIDLWNYEEFDYAKPSWFIKKGSVNVTFSGGIGAGVYQEP